MVSQKLIHWILTLVVTFCSSDALATKITPDPDLANVQIDITKLPEFKGDKNNSKDLRVYITNLLEKYYGLEEEQLSKPSSKGVKAIRDLVHKTNNHYKDIKRPPIQCALSSLACLFEQKGGGNCGFSSFSLFNIYSAFDYKTRRFDIVNGSLKTAGAPGSPLEYTQSHAFTEVYLPEINKYVIQDSTFNSQWIDCKSKTPLNYAEIQKIFLLEEKMICALAGEFHYRQKQLPTLTEKHLVKYHNDYVGYPITIYQYDKARTKYSLRSSSQAPNKSEGTVVQLNQRFKTCGCQPNKIENMKSCHNCMNKNIPTVAFLGHLDSKKWTLQSRLKNNFFIYNPTKSSFQKGRFDDNWQKAFKANADTPGHKKEHWLHNSFYIDQVLDEKNLAHVNPQWEH